MCLILIALDSHPDYSLVVAANRDEFYDRPSVVAAFWADLRQKTGKEPAPETGNPVPGKPKADETGPGRK